MNAEFKIDLDLAYRFHDIFGNKPVVLDGTLAYRPNQYIYQTMPESGSICGNDLVYSLFKKSKCFLGVRHFCNESLGRGDDLINMLICKPPYDMSRIQSKARNQTRRGLENIQCVQLEPSNSVLHDLFKIYKDNVTRLGLFKTERGLLKRWNKWLAILREPGLVDLWAGTYNGEFVTFVVVAHFYKNGGEIVLHRSHHSALRYYPNNAIIYRMLLHYFEKDRKFLSYGMRSWNEKDVGLLHFKKNMGFEEIPWRHTFHLSPIFGRSTINFEMLRKIHRRIKG